jgi:hypothetical protein
MQLVATHQTLMVLHNKLRRELKRELVLCIAQQSWNMLQRLHINVKHAAYLVLPLLNGKRNPVPFSGRFARADTIVQLSKVGACRTCSLFRGLDFAQLTLQLPFSLDVRYAAYSTTASPWC